MDWTANPAAVTPPWAPGAALLALALVLAWGWARERRSLARRSVVQRLYRLGEELIAGRSFAESLRLLHSVLPELLRVTEVHVYVLDRGSKTLQRAEVDSTTGLVPVPMLAEEPDGFRKKLVELCYRNRSSIAVPDTRRSPLLDAGQAWQAPRSAMFLPMVAQGEALGVLGIGDSGRARQFREEERAAAQHLANQLAIGMRLLEQKSLREQAVGGERLDTICRLVSTAAGELKKPLERLVECSRKSGSEGTGHGAENETAQQALRAQQAFARLLKFIRLPQEEERTVDLVGVLRGLLGIRQKAWEEQGLQVRDLVAPGPLFVRSRSGTLERLILSLWTLVEQRLAQSREKPVTLRAFRLAARAQVDISWPGTLQDLETAGAGEDQEDLSEDAYSFAACRDLVRLHGGRLTLTKSDEGTVRLEIDLPLAESDSMGVAAASRPIQKPATPLTALVLEPDAEARQALVSALGALGHRSVTAASAEEAAELVKRLRFDVLFCSSLLPGAGWPACFENSRVHVGSFVVLTRGHDPALAAALPAGEARALAKPVHPDELSRVLGEVEARAAGRGR